MRMNIGRFKHRAGSGALYQSQLLSAVARPWMSLFEPGRILENARADESLPLARICSLCHRLQWPLRGAAHKTPWIEPEDYYALGGPTDVRAQPTVCTDCRCKVTGDPA